MERANLDNNKVSDIEALVYVTHQLYLELKYINDFLEDETVDYIIKNKLSLPATMYDTIKYLYDEKKQIYTHSKPAIKILKGDFIINFW